MPYGCKPDVDGEPVAFDEVYEDIIAPAVARVPGLACRRSIDVEHAGSIHERMIRDIFESRVAVVDTSTLNANVFYELGVRHALKRGVTVLIQRKGTTSPFNIAGFNVIEYEYTPRGVRAAQDKIERFIRNGLA